jgi:hypothetical protein
MNSKPSSAERKHLARVKEFDCIVCGAPSPSDAHHLDQRYAYLFKTGSYMKRTFILSHSTARSNALSAIKDAPDGYVVTISEPTRNADQNALLWICLNAFSKQLLWPVNGAMTKLPPEEWKDILSAGYRKYNPRVAQGLDGGMVMLGLRTSRMGKRDFADFLDYIGAVAADRGVNLEPA